MRLPCLAGCLIAAALALPAAPNKTRNVILVTADGQRWQEVFTGIDPTLMNEKNAGMADAAELRQQLWRESAMARREALMPFFWTQLVPHGVAWNNVHVSNAYRVSYPGYSEILTGRADNDRIRGNDKIQNPNQTVLEFVRHKLGLTQADVALIGTWEVFQFIGESRPGTITINAGYRAIHGSPRLDELSRAQFDVLTPWNGERHDYFTFEIALEYLKLAKPRLLHIAFGETDSWAHDQRYDRVLESIHYFDHCLEKLWDTLESLPEYRRSTTLIVTSDHGRGRTLADWGNHGHDVEGADRVWLAVRGPDTQARGEMPESGTIAQRDIAPTILELLGIDYREYRGVLGRPIRAVLPTAN